MTDNEIIKALERCSDGSGTGLVQATISLINRLQAEVKDKDALLYQQGGHIRMLELAGKEKLAEIDKLSEQFDKISEVANGLHRENVRQKAEIEKLQAEVDKQYEIAEANVRAEIASGGTSCHWCENKVRAEAIKPFAKRLLLEFPSGSFSYSHIRYKVNNLVKEMVGDDNEN